jgi:hypothetical protein
VKKEIKTPKSAEPNRINVYTCQKCGGKTVTIDVHDMPQFEWFKPIGSEYNKLSRAMKEHVDKGGLDLRKRTA